MFTIKISDEILDKLRTMLEDEDEGTGVLGTAISFDGPPAGA